MIHEFKMLIKHVDTEEEQEADGAIEMSSVVYCWASIEEEGSTCVYLDTDVSLIVRMKTKDFIDIWRACTEDIKI